MWLQIYLGLLVLVGFIMFNTQIIIKKAQSGVLDYMEDAVLIYANLVAVFWGVLAILVR